MPRAVVIGGGVAGPATAMFLAADGWDVEIFEATTKPDDYAGAFLNVATNGLAVLEALRLRDRLLSDAHPAPHMIMWSSSGKRLGSVPNGPAGDPACGSAVVRRGWLHKVLREGVEDRGIPINFGARLTDITAEPGAVHATFADGRKASGDILIGCDGIGSPTRTYIDPNAPTPRYSGLVGLGGFARVPGLTPTPATQHFLFGRRSFFGYLVRADGAIYWFANITAPEPARGSLRDVSAAEWLDRLRKLHQGDPYPVPQIINGHVGELGPTRSTTSAGFPAGAGGGSSRLEMRCTPPARARAREPRSHSRTHRRSRCACAKRPIIKQHLPATRPYGSLEPTRSSTMRGRSTVRNGSARAGWPWPSVTRCCRYF
jgi:2-polyprenyl-6-methoxyphenol hydroxylase-like FAD-dependent oxidoreductase